MPYCTPTDVRLRAVGMTAQVIPDVSSGSLNLTTCIAEAEGEIEEAARAGGYETPFNPAPARIRDLCAIGALARARRALQLGNQPTEEPDPYRRELEACLGLLRQGELDLGTVAVTAEAVTFPAGDGEWAQLAHRGLLLGSAIITSEAGSLTYHEERAGYEPGYQPDAVKDYRVDHREGRVARLDGGRIGLGQRVLVSYQYSYRQPRRGGEAEYEGRTASGGEMVRGDAQ